MPEIDNLMQAWDSEFEQSIQKLKLTDESVPIPLELLAKLSCNILDIPVY